MSGSVGWNPWHGCTKISSGCRHCYVYRRDEMVGVTASSSLCRKTKAFDLPVRRTRDGQWRIEPGKTVFTCFTSDFLLTDADDWRPACWDMIRRRPDCRFLFFTKRIDRLAECLPADWGDGYENVTIGCTVENQDRADYRLPIFLALPIRHRTIVAEPLLEALDLSPYLDERIEELDVGGESGPGARPCRYEWVLSLKEQCDEKNVPFSFHQTGARFVKDGKLYLVPRREQHKQARKAGLDTPRRTRLRPSDRVVYGQLRLEDWQNDCFKE
ncbi:MAG: DUF5131 family protein [Eubacteriales bacterium]|nr:DUF5131 family protein [Eubacteriales bacterium]